jgi:hypothetical protein
VSVDPFVNRTVFFQTIGRDTIQLNGQTSYPIFAEANDNAPSVRNLTERQALEWLFKDALFASDFTQAFFPGTPLVRYHFSLVRPFTQPDNKPGDIDLMLVALDLPHQAVALEAKRIKIETCPDGSVHINRAQEIGYGIQQANSCRNIGFHRTYLLLLLLDDGRAKSSQNAFLRHATGREIDQILSLPWSEALNPDVGVVYVRSCQAIDKTIDEASSIQYCIDKHAARQQQTDEMINKVRHLQRSR